MTKRHLTSTLSAVANRLHVIAGLTTEVRRSALVEVLVERGQPNDATNDLTGDRSPQP